jgi:lysylphosphatidylglycerol synthetase-like protein (DUF2156 family)
MVAVRRRKGRRRSDPPVKRRVLSVLLTVFAGLLLLVAIPGARNAVRKALHSVSASIHISPEVIALVVAGLALLFLLPGVEDKVLTTFGIRKPRRSRNVQR